MSQANWAQPAFLDERLEMCGLAGIFDLTGPGGIDEAALRRMTAAMRHRGPDGDGFHIERGIGLGHRRLAIIDIGGGDQPMYNEDGSVVIVFNGEIYNHNELRPKLEAAGHLFRSRCDTEAIIHAWESWGPGCLDHLSGMFAFALWDRNRGQLFLARDRLGKKPLYYATLERWPVRVRLGNAGIGGVARPAPAHKPDLGRGFLHVRLYP